MKIKRRKLLSLVLVLALVFANFSGMEVRAEGTEGHTHNWKYSIKEKTTDTIVASCETATCETATSEAQIVAKDAGYTGEKYIGATVNYSGEFPDKNLEITYYQEGRALSDVPKDAGKYEAKICKENVTASTRFQINKIKQIASVSMENYILGKTPSNPTVSGVKEEASVTYYYNMKGGDWSPDNAFEWQNTDKETLEPGTYYMYAVLNETKNYEKTILGPVSFNVSKNDMSDIEVADINTTYDGEEHTIIPSIPDGASISYKRNEKDEFSTDVPKFKDAGDYTIYYIVKKSGYTPVNGSAKVHIEKANIESALIELNPGDTQKTGEEITQSITKVIVNGKELTKDKDYRIDEKSVLSATECGEYTITIEGNGNYKGKKSITWKITKNSMPSPGPSGEPSPGPSDKPTPGPSDEPTPGPSDEPTTPPTTPPTEQPTASPSVTPTLTPTPAPTVAPDMKISQSPVDAEGEYFVPVGKEVELQITVENADKANLEYQWYCDGKKVDGNSDKFTVKLKKKGTVIYTCDIYNKVTKETKKEAGSWKVTGYNEKVSITIKKTKKIKDILGKNVSLSEIKVPKSAKKALTVNVKKGTIKMKKYCKNAKVTLVTKDGQSISITVTTAYPKPVLKVKKGAVKAYVDGRYCIVSFKTTNVKGATKIMFEYSKKKNKGYKKSKFSSFYVKEGNVRYFRAIAYYGKQKSPYTKVVKIKG